MKILIIFDGGLAPGYTTVAVGLVEEAEKLGWEPWIARSGFRSLCEGITDEPQLVRVVSHPIKAYELNIMGTPTEAIGRRSFDSGSDYRSERFPEFSQEEKQADAAEEIQRQGFEAVVICGGNGSFKGAQALVNQLPSHIQIGFINISADSDLSGDRSIGFLSCAEHGAKIARGLYEDAYTHRRTYFLEMMGNESGRHALHSGSAARAHLIILPTFDFTPDIYKEIAQALNKRRHALVIVSEGYKKKHRKENKIKKNAAQFFADELKEYGLIDNKNKRVICEPFSRHLRGMQPLMVDCQVAQLKCQILMGALKRGHSEIMAFYLGSQHLGVREFSKIGPDNSTEKSFSRMINRLDLPKFNAYTQQVLIDQSH